MDESKLRYICDDTISVMQGLKVLNKTGKRIIFLVKGGVLTGTLTYGDVSRWIINGKELDALAKDAATLEPYCISESNRDKAKSIFAEKGINALPVVDENKRIIDIIFKETQVVSYEKINLPVVIMAGGKGTRLYPYTKILPKPLIPIGDVPITEHIINRFVSNGCSEFYFIVNYKKNMIKAYFNEIDRNYEVHYVDENIPLGTGGGLSLMKGLISSTFILTNCDSIIDIDYSRILKEHKEKGNSITMICSNSTYEIPYGIINAEKDGELTSMKEKPHLNYLVNTGSYIVEPDVIDSIEPNKSIGFPDVASAIKKAGKRVGVFVVDEEDWLDMGQFDAMEKMKKHLGIIE